MQRLSQVLAAISDPTRREILSLVREQDVTVMEIVGKFQLSQPTISAHLKVLEQAGLISRGRVAQTRPCRFAASGLVPLEKWLAELRPQKQRSRK
jgi:DNA-binding transcriptional ArsR family regulator